MKPVALVSAAAPAALQHRVRVQLDGQPYEVALQTTLADLVAGLGHAPEAVGTAVNGAFVARTLRAQRALHEGDAVVFFQPIVGG